MFRRRNVAGRSVKGCTLCTVHRGSLWHTVVHHGTLWRQAQSKGVVAGEPLTEPRGLLSGFEPLKGTAE